LLILKAPGLILLLRHLLLSDKKRAEALLGVALKELHGLIDMGCS
jgi:hypothetical protein